MYHCWGTGAIRSPNEGWLVAWQRELDFYNIESKTPVMCCEKDCNDIASVGAHIEYIHGPHRDVLHKLVGYRSKWYIVPTCSKHNVWRTMSGNVMICKEVYAMRVRATLNERISAALLGSDMRKRHANGGNNINGPSTQRRA